MTAINVIKQRDAVHVLTDGASWIRAETGAFGPAGSKQWPLPHLKCVVTARGPRLGASLVADFINSSAKSYDDLKANAARIIGGAVNFHSVILSENAFGTEIEVVVAGWSETHGPDAFVVCDHSQNSDRHSWAVMDTGSILMAPGDAKIQALALEKMSGVSSADDMDPVRDGLAIMEAQRESSEITRGMSVVGAFVQLSTVTKDAIQTKIIKTWPYEWGSAQSGSI